MTLQQFALFLARHSCGPSSMNPMFKFWLDMYTAPLLNNPQKKGYETGSRNHKNPKTTYSGKSSLKK